MLIYLSRHRCYHKPVKYTNICIASHLSCRRVVTAHPGISPRWLGCAISGCLLYIDSLALRSAPLCAEGLCGGRVRAVQAFLPHADTRNE